MNPERKAQLEATLPSAASTRERFVAHLNSTGLPLPQFAPFTGYSATALRAFINDRYEQQNNASDLSIREALEAYLATNPLAVSSAMHHRMYETENTRQMRYWFDQCMRHGFMTVLYGPPGSQKTFVAQHLVAEFNRQELDRRGSRDRAYMVRCSVGIRPRDLMAKICAEMGVRAGKSLLDCMTAIRLSLTGRRVLLILDECQLAGLPALEAIRELHDEAGVLLMGSHALRQFFEARAAELEQFNSRIEDSVELTGITEADALNILAAELPTLSKGLAKQAVKDAFVPDRYSATRGKHYCSVRRLFKSIAAFREIEAADTAKESIQ